MSSLAAGQGLEPRYADPESAVLPLDDPAIKRIILNMWFTYILLCRDGTYYTGSTNDVEKRFKDHLSGKGARYTKAHKPEKIIYREGFSTKSEALKRESEIKKLSRLKKEELVSR